MIAPGSLTADKLVRQRGGGDCMVAAIATVLQRSYDDVAAMFGAPAQSVGNLFEAEAAVALLNAGYAAVSLQSSEIQAECNYPPEWPRPRVPSGSELRSMIDGRVGIVIADLGGTDPLQRFHAGAWDGVRLWDCIDGSEHVLSAVKIASALLVFPLPQTERIN